MPLQVRIDGAAGGATNMRTDTELLDRCAAGEIAGLVRLYWFEPPCLSLGRLQSLDDVDLTRCEQDGVDVVRRPSGGRAVLHDQELTYAVVCRDDDPRFGGRVLQACERIHAVIAEGLRRLGVETVAQCTPKDLRTTTAAIARLADCFARPSAHELVDAQGRKLVGSAQARRGAALLQHGSILLDPPRAAVYLRRGPVAPATGGIRSILGRQVQREELIEAVNAAFADAAALDTTTA
ncbi:MAG: hypothetical protein JOY68_02865 [Candidatus Dormibacteraeota bacterium]|nr:hypothetical protein [Candidatus Dormibacteraeota bacterium]